MQPYNGDTFALPPELNRAGRRASEELQKALIADDHVGRTVSAADLERLERDLPEDAPRYDLEQAIKSAREHGPLVGVTGEVAQAQRLGHRELDRRRKRKAAKAARKRNR